MPANNSKVLSQQLLKQLNNKFVIEFNEAENVITVGLTDRKRITKHDADKPFHINAKCFKRKVCFTITDIEIWKTFIKEKHSEKYTLFDVHNAITILKVSYQPVTEKTVLTQLKKTCNSIKQI